MSDASPAFYRPADEAELAQLLQAPGPAFELVAGGSKRGIGKPLEAPILDLSRLSGVVAYEPGELVLTARPATSLAQIQALLEVQHQRLGFEPPELLRQGILQEQTIGGVLMANSSGSRRVTGGSARDHFLGFRAVNGRGEAFVGGGRVVKNVTGFDLPKALAGSWGTLAALTEVTVRVMPAAESETTLLFAAASAQEAIAVASTALASMFEVSCAAYLPTRGIALRLEGLRTSVQSRSGGLRAALGREVQQVLDTQGSRQWWAEVGSVAALERFPVLWRLSVSPSDAARIVAELEPEAYQLDWGGGLVWIGADRVEAGRVRGALRGGHATLVRAPQEERRANAVFQPQGPAFTALAARFKTAFDPGHRLNPGRMG